MRAARQTVVTVRVRGTLIMCPLVPKVVRRADARVEKRKLIMGSFLYLHGCGGTVNSCGGSR
ncbi:hypothetical protein Ahu01nite_065540 [Winogradskya humida]|uniref:Uncharacterized protein n=1 Tax=Winogradskya humida TaxID=113566 RepID=A0ABQ3ZZC6_9ACTN|nr:hypothetical protein Ahu01nite_065540 [Actinoplanes humidus]